MSTSKPLTFGEVSIGAYFIVFPRDGDNSGHSGYRRTHNLFRKTNASPIENSTNVSANVSVHIPDFLEVVLVSDPVLYPTPVWRTLDGTLIAIENMNDGHLLNTERAIAAGTAPATEEDRLNITRERERRGLTALRPRKDVTARTSKLVTELIDVWRQASRNERKKILESLARFLKRYAHGNEDMLLAADYLESTLAPPEPSHDDIDYRANLKPLRAGDRDD